MITNKSEQEIFDAFIGSGYDEQELEVRFNSFFHHGSGISPQEYFHIIGSFETSEEFNITTEYPTSSSLRRRVTKDKQGRTKYAYEVKEVIDTYRSEEYGYKVARSKEEEAIEPEVVLKMLFSKVTFSREKNRHSQKIVNGKLQIDATEVVEKKSNVVTTRYELELEVIDKSCTFQDFQDGIRQVFGLLYQTRFMFTQQELLAVQEYTHTSLNGRKKKFTKGNFILPLQEARSLKYEDLVSGGVTYGYEGTPKHVSGETKRLSAKMTVSIKADGIRKLCVVHGGNLWLLYKKEANLVVRNILSDFNGSIFEGELITYDHLRVKEGSKDLLRFLAYDTLFYIKQDMREKYHSGRLSYATAFAHSIGTTTELGERKEIRSPFEVSTKPIHHLDKAEIMEYFLFSVKETYYFDNAIEFFSNVNYLLDVRTQKVYKDDGLILTPTHEPYNLKPARGYRVLTNAPDICKWKEPEKLTIDVRVVFDRGVPVGFKTTKDELVDGITQKDIDASSFKQFSKDLVYEVALKDGLWSVERIRRDKPGTNSLSVIKNNLKLLRKGNIIYEQTIRGKDSNLFRKYQNRVKLELFLENPGWSLLDIGSGFGGDLNKWRDYKKIIAVEPNSENIKEFQRRYRAMTGAEAPLLDEDNYEELLPEVSNERLIILQTGGENHGLITEIVNGFVKRPVDVISSMFSMSFFWKDEIMVQELLTTIANNLDPNHGKFIFTTINGENVREIFEPLFQIGMNLDEKAKFGDTFIEYKPELKQLYLYSEDVWQINPRVPLELQPIEIVNKRQITNIYLDFGGNNYLQKTEDGVLVNFEGTIVNEQKEYLVNLDDIARVCPIEYVETTSKEQFLPVGLYQLGTMYSAGVASFTEAVYAPFAENELRKIYTNETVIESDKKKGLYIDFTPFWWTESDLVRIKTETGSIKECILRAANSTVNLNLPDEIYLDVFDNNFELIILSPTKNNHVIVETFLDSIKKKHNADVLIIIEKPSARGRKFDLLGKFYSDEKISTIFKAADILPVICKLVAVYQELLQNTHKEINDYAFIFILEEILFNAKQKNINYLIKDIVKEIKTLIDSNLEDDMYYNTFSASYLLNILNLIVKYL